MTGESRIILYKQFQECYRAKPFILGNIGIVLGALSRFAILRISRIRKLPGELRLKPERWKTKGWWLSIAILTLGVIIAGASIMSGPKGKTEVAYGVRLDTGTSEEETTFFSTGTDSPLSVASSAFMFFA